MSYVFLAVLAVTVYVLLSRIQWQDPGPHRVKPYAGSPRTEPDWHPSRPEPAAAKASRNMHEDEMAEELSTQLDSRVALLEQRIREADLAAARLEAALAAAEATAGHAAKGDSSSEAEEPSRDKTPESLPVSQAEALRASVAVEPPAPGIAKGPDVSSPRPGADRRYDEIYALADYGFAPAEIAGRVGSPVGEVELILSLRGKR
jgi:hypothetical protein